MDGDTYGGLRRAGELAIEALRRLDRELGAEYSGTIETPDGQRLIEAAAAHSAIARRAAGGVGRDAPVVTP